MYHKIRITVVSLIAVAICVLSSGATLSYFTDSKSTTNHFVVGNASTSLAIYDDVTGDEYHVLDDSEYTVVANGVLKNNTKLSGIPFYLQATNDGNIPVYQRFRVVIPKDLASVVTLNTPTNSNYTVTYDPSVNDTYAEYYIVSNTALAVGNTTAEWPTTSIHIGDISGVDNSLFTCANSNANNCVLGISVYSDAIQAAGFTSAAQALANLVETY